MNISLKSSTQCLAGLGLGFFASLAAAQPSSGAVITYGPVIAAAAVPAISGSLLIALAGLLAFITFRLLKGKSHSSINFVIAFVAVSALASGAGGIKLMADAHAIIVIPEVNMTVPNGGTLNIPSGTSRVVNGTELRQQIKNIQYAEGCSNQATLANGTHALSSASSAGTCSTSTTLAPQSTEYCEIEVFCPSTCAFAWSPNFYVDFSGGNFVGSGNYWSDSSCTEPNGNLSRKWVYSPSGQANATSICIANMGEGFAAIPSHGPLVFECVI